jgi:hypothetical protein
MTAGSAKLLGHSGGEGPEYTVLWGGDNITDVCLAADGALIVSTPQDVALIDVRKEVTFCKKTGLPVLGVVENMSGLEVPLRTLTFKDAVGKDVTREVLQALPTELQGVSACCDVFVASTGGAAAMAAQMGVPFLGRVPLDPELSRAAELGESMQGIKSSRTVQAFNGIVSSVFQPLLCTCPSIAKFQSVVKYFEPLGLESCGEIPGIGGRR